MAESAIPPRPPPSPPLRSRSVRVSTRAVSGAFKTRATAAAATATCASDGSAALHQSLWLSHIAACMVLGVLTLVAFVTAADSRRVPVTLQSVVDESGAAVVLYHVSLHWLVMGFTITASLHHFYAAVVAFRSYVAMVAAGCNWIRWHEYSFTSSQMIVIMGLSLGITDLFTLALLACSQASCILFGALYEATRHTRAHVYGWLPFIFEWAVLFWKLFEHTDLPLRVHVVVWAEFCVFCVFGAVQWAQLLDWPPFRHFVYVEVAYTSYSIAAKSILAVAVLSLLH